MIKEVLALTCNGLMLVFNSNMAELELQCIQTARFHGHRLSPRLVVALLFMGS